MTTFLWMLFLGMCGALNGSIRHVKARLAHSRENAQRSTPTADDIEYMDLKFQRDMASADRRIASEQARMAEDPEGARRQIRMTELAKKQCVEKHESARKEMQARMNDTKKPSSKGILLWTISGLAAGFIIGMFSH